MVPTLCKSFLGLFSLRTYLSCFISSGLKVPLGLGNWSAVQRHFILNYSKGPPTCKAGQCGAVLARDLFMVYLALSTLPADRRLHTECNTHLTPKAFVISLVVWDHKGRLLSLHKNPGNPNLGIISLSCPSEACFCPCGECFHPPREDTLSSQECT